MENDLKHAEKEERQEPVPEERAPTKHRRTKRRFDPNIQKKTYFVPSLRRNVTLTLSAKGIKVIDARGIESVVKDLIAKGVKL